MTLNLKDGEYFGIDLKSSNNDFIKLNIKEYRPDCALEKHIHDEAYESILMGGNYFLRALRMVLINCTILIDAIDSFI